MFTTLHLPPVATSVQFCRSALRAILSMISDGIGSGRSSAADIAKHMDLYHADDTKLREMGLTRMDVIRRLETKPRAHGPRQTGQQTGHSGSRR